MKPMIRERRGDGKEIVSLMVTLPLDHIREIWAGMSKQHRDEMFGNGHAQELDEMVKGLGKQDTSHLAGDQFGDHLRDLHDGQGMNDPDAARVLHTASGVRMAQRAVQGPKKIGHEAHRTTLAILNARYKQK